MDEHSIGLMDHLNIGLILLDEKQRVIIWNRWLAEYTGKPKKEVFGQYIHQLYPLFKKETYQGFFHQCLTQYQGIFCSSSLHPLFFAPAHGRRARQNLQLQYFSLHGKDAILLQVFDVTHQEEKIQLLNREIQERKKVENDLKEKEERLRQITDNMQDMVCRIDDREIMTYVSPSYKKILGFSPEDLLGRPFSTYIHPQDIRRMGQEIYRLKKGQDIQVEFRHQQKEGPYRWVEATGKTIEEGGFIRGAILTTRDISRRKEIEEVLQKSREILDSILDSLDDGIWSVKVDTGEVLFMNQATGSIYGMESEELKKDPTCWQKILHPQDQSRITAAIENILKDYRLDEEYRVIHPKGDVRWIRDRTRVILDAEKRPIRIDGILTDITAWKENEAERKAREERFRTLIESVPDIIIQLDLSGRFVWTNGNGYCFFGDACEKRHYSQYAAAPEEAQEMERHIQPLLQGEGEETWFSVFLQRVDGQNRLVSCSGRILKKEGEPTGILFTARDITDIRRTEASLKANTLLLEGVLNGISDVIAVQRPDHTIERYNQAGYQLLNLSPEQVKGKRCFQLLGQDRECEDCTTREAVIKKHLVSKEQYFPELDIYLNCRSNPILDEKGNVSLIVEQLRDITKEKEMENEIRRSEEYVRSIISLIPDLLVTFSARGEYLEIWAKDWEYLIFPTEELLGKKVEEVFPEELAARIIHFINRALTTRELQTFEYMITGKERMEFEARFMARSDDEVLAIIRDITQRKKRERALEEEMERAQELQESLRPSQLPIIPNGGLAAAHQQASHVSGDYYDFQLTEEGLYFLMADVTGHGFDASLITVFVSSFFRRELGAPHSVRSPYVLLHHLHRDFIQQGFSDDYSIEVFLGRCDLQSMRIEYAVSGAIRSLLMDDEGNIMELPHNHGMIINNIIQDPCFGQGEMTMETGQSLLIYTDGIDEPFLTKDTQGRPWVEEIVGEASGLLSLQELLERIIGDTTYSFQDSLVDDMTIIGLATHSPEERKKRWLCPQDLTALARKTQEIVFLLAQSLPIDVDLVSIALFEALSNAIDHGVGSQTISVEASWTPRQLCIGVTSQGSQFDWRKILNSYHDMHGYSERGRGLGLIRMATHRFTFNETGDRITMAWRLPTVPS